MNIVKMSLTPPSVSRPPPPSTALPVRSIPGSHGWPVVGPIKDRLEYFWFQGPETFFRKRMEQYKSTVFRTNVPPTFPLFTGVNPNVVAVLDTKSFAHMFDMELVDKRNVLVGDFMPSVSYTGDIRVCAYLDTSEPQHTQVKRFSMDILKRSSKTWVSDLTTSLDTMWDSLESSMATSSSSSASYFLPLQKALFTFLSKSIVGADPAASPEISASGHVMLDKWLAVQLLPTINIGIAQPLEEIFLHSFSYPFALVAADYKKLYRFVEQHGSATVDRGVSEFGLTREEAIHNILFILGFNAFGGFSVFLPGLLSRVGSDSSGLQEKLRKEAVELGGSDLSFDSVKNMELTQSVVYEALRFKPPVPLQFGRARKDFVLSSHDSAFEVKKGELLCGFQQLVMRDPKVFDDPETFKPDRFTGSGRELLDSLYWSNGPQTGMPSEANKQCAAKEVVAQTATLFLAHMFHRYDSVTAGSSAITAVKKV